MNGKSKNEGIHVIADFTDRAIPFSAAPLGNENTVITKKRPAKKKGGGDNGARKGRRRK